MSDARRVDFTAERDRASTSWQRADGVGALIESTDHPAEWIVCLHGGNAHTVRLWRRGDEFVGWCDCNGFEYHDGPCAHLCTVRQAAFVRAAATDGRRVSVPSRRESEEGAAQSERRDAGTDISRRLCGRRCRPVRTRGRGGARDPPSNHARGGVITRCSSRRRMAIHHVITAMRSDYVRGGGAK